MNYVRWGFIYSLLTSCLLCVFDFCASGTVCSGFLWLTLFQKLCLCFLAIAYSSSYYCCIATSLAAVNFGESCGALILEGDYYLDLFASSLIFWLFESCPSTSSSYYNPILPFSCCLFSSFLFFLSLFFSLVACFLLLIPSHKWPISAMVSRYPVHLTTLSTNDL